MTLDEFLKKKKKAQNCKRCINFRYVFDDIKQVFTHKCYKNKTLFNPCHLFKKAKLHSIKTIIDEITFHSLKEGKRYIELKQQKQQGIIKDFSIQPKFILLPKFVICKDCRKRNDEQIKSRFKCVECCSKEVAEAEGAITYSADFKIINIDGSIIIEDTKGFRTEAFKRSKKLLLYKYPEIELRVF